jgi:dTDP-4-dehydrorhamnose reductase
MILVTGGAGQVATELAQRAADRVVRVGRPAFDFDRPETIEQVFRQVNPSLVVNAAAWTAVDAAETNEAAARRANCDGPAQLARLCNAAGIPIIHVSTDYVFDGAKGAPYGESDLTSPTGVYGSTKLDGEHAVMAACDQAVILRTSWVYAAVGKNFVRTMLGAALKTNTLKVVADQQGCPTNAGDLADAILAVVARIEAGWHPDYAGVFNAAGTGSTTWHGLAVAAFTEAARHGRPMPTVNAIATADWPTPARRPADSRLDCTRLERVFGIRLPEWQPSLARTVDAIIAGS